MQEPLTRGAKKGVSIGQEGMKILLKEPIKEAVEETFAEEEVITRKSDAEPSNPKDRDHSIGEIQLKQTAEDSWETVYSESDAQSRDEESTDSGSTLFDPKVLVPVVALVGVVIALRRLGEGTLGTANLEALIVRDEEVPMEDDMSKSAPTDRENDHRSDAGSESVSA